MPMETFEGTREFEEYIDKEVLVLLRDDTYLYGIFKSYDQYNSISLNFTTLRIFHENKYAEKRLGLISLRGESIVLIGINKHDFRKKQKVDFDILENELIKNKNINIIK